MLFLTPQLYLIRKYSFRAEGPDLSSRFWLRTVPVLLLSVAAAAHAPPLRRGPGSDVPAARIRWTLVFIAFAMVARWFWIPPSGTRA